MAQSAITWWHASAPLPAPPSLGSPPAATFVAIVGSGMMGASLAWWLTRHGIAPLVLERGAPAVGASGRNTGLIVAGAHEEYVELARQLGPQAAEELIRGSIENHTLLQTFLESRGLGEALSQAGFLALWTSNSERRTFEESAPMMNALGWEMELLDHAECERVLGVTIAKRIKGGAWTPRDSMVQPVTYVHALASAAQENGAQFFYGADVLRVTRRGATWLLDTSRGQVAAQHVVLATNEKTPLLLPETQPLLRSICSTIAATEPVVSPTRVGWAEHGVSPYGRPTGDSRLVLGGFARRLGAISVMENCPDPPDDLERQLSAYLAGTFPECLPARVAGSWTGAMTFTSDRLPLVGQWPPAEHLWLLTAFGGQGIPFSQWAPMLLAEAIADPAASRIPWYFSPERFSP